MSDRLDIAKIRNITSSLLQEQIHDNTEFDPASSFGGISTIDIR